MQITLSFVYVSVPNILCISTKDFLGLSRAVIAEHKVLNLTAQTAEALRATAISGSGGGEGQSGHAAPPPPESYVAFCSCRTIWAAHIHRSIGLSFCHIRPNPPWFLCSCMGDLLYHGAVAWWDLGLIWMTWLFLQCFDTVGFVIWPLKTDSSSQEIKCEDCPRMTYNVLSGTLNPTIIIPPRGPKWWKILARVQLTAHRNIVYLINYWNAEKAADSGINSWLSWLNKVHFKTLLV